MTTNQTKPKPRKMRGVGTYEGGELVRATAENLHSTCTTLVRLVQILVFFVFLVLTEQFRLPLHLRGSFCADIMNY